MSFPLDDTIAAVASPPGGAARAILRLSGPDVRACVGRVFRPDEPVDLYAVAAPTAMAGSLALEGLAARIPCELYLWPEGRSYTGQPVAEIHTLGSPPLVEKALRALCAAGARLAERGEFTLRAFLSGRLDLTRAEAVLGVIDAAGPAELAAALTQLAGGLGAPLSQLRDGLLDLLADVEAGLDFADEELPFITSDQLSGRLAAAAEEVQRLLRQMTSRAEAAERTRVVLFGWPNTGKSSLFNALAGGTALVSDHPGTTRDYLTAELDLGGARCVLVDTAGMEPESQSPESQSPQDPVRRAARAAAADQERQAQVRLFCLDASRPPNAWEGAQLAGGTDGLVVLTKIDLPRRIEPGPDSVATSSVTGEGIARLRERIAEAVLASAPPGEVVAGTAVRCRESLRLAARSLHRAGEACRLAAGEELVAAEVRAALEELGKTVGAVYTEDVLDRIFSRFCIGK